jgi:hypothetical protein
LTLAKSDPQTGDHWLAIFQPKEARFRRRASPPPWEFISGPISTPISALGDLKLIDRDADETFISHLLDSLAALKIEALAPRGTLESFGLNPPRFALQWKLPDRAFELQVGDSPHLGKSYLILEGQRIYIGSGSAIRLLELIESFDSLRKKEWSDLRPDDVDEISIYKLGNLLFYAQREGDRWTDQKHRPVLAGSHLSETLEEVIRHRPLQLMDDPGERARIQRHIQSKPFIETRLTDRLGKTTSLTLGKDSGKLYGISSARPHLIFVWNQILEQKLLKEFLRK